MKRILIPTDFSQESENALEFAIEIAKSTGAELNIVNFVEPVDESAIRITGEVKLGDSSEDDLFTLKLIEGNKQRLHDVVSNIEQTNFTVKVDIINSKFREGVENFVKKYHCDCVIIGTTGEESAREFFTGNHTEKLIEHLGVPVISVKDKVKIGITTNLVLGLDIIYKSYRQEGLEVIKSIAKALKANVHLVDVIMPNENRSKESVKTDLEILAKEAGFDNFSIEVIENDNKEQGLISYSKQVNASMIATIAHISHRFSHIFKHSFSEKLTKESAIPVLTLNSNNI